MRYIACFLKLRCNNALNETLIAFFAREDHSSTDELDTSIEAIVSSKILQSLAY